MNGTGRFILKAIHGTHPFSLALANNALYWTDWSGHGIGHVLLSTMSTDHFVFKYPLLDTRAGGLILVNTSREISQSFFSLLQ